MFNFNYYCCCYCRTKKPTPTNDSPNVIDVYVTPCDPYQFPILTQPHKLNIPRELQQQENDIDKYKNDPKGYNNFAYVDEIDEQDDANKSVTADHKQFNEITAKCTDELEEIRRNNSDDNDLVIANAFRKFIDDVGVKGNAEIIYNFNKSSEQFATPKLHENYLFRASILIRETPKRKFPHAFDKKLYDDSVNCDVVRKPPVILTKLQLLMAIPSDYRYGNFRLNCLDAHNSYRAQHGCPPLIESIELNKLAEDWAQYLAANDHEIYHRPKNRFGENLYWTNNGLGHSRMAVAAWYNEIQYYNYENPEFSQQTGHFTQLLWRSTQEIGSAMAKIGNNIWVVCNYNPPGNVIGNFNEEFVPRLL